jgi:hypothetical protein
MTKALALFAEGLRLAPWLPDAEVRRTRLLDELSLRLRDGGWGYEFDVQTRWGFYPAGSPNVIVTAFVGEALAGAGRACPPRVREWLSSEMLHPEGFLRYVPGNDALVHNANLLGARTLWRCGGDPELVRVAVHASLDRQRRDGTWPYGEGRGLEWIDNFHTAYVLLALHDLLAVVPEASDALERGVAAWGERCFAADGTPYYYADRPGPVDIHNIATAVHASWVLPGNHKRHLAPGAIHALLLRQRRDGAFVAATRGTPYMRWNQAHAYLALAEVSNG